MVRPMKTVKTVFMIDDDVEDQEIFAETIFSIDPLIKCIVPIDGRQAIGSLLIKGAILPDFIFVDLNMPNMNGYEFLKEIKDQEHLNHIPVVVYTTSSDSKDREKAKRLGAHSFITKPSALLELRRELATILLKGQNQVV